jgi:hypothetical protein
LTHRVASRACIQQQGRKGLKGAATARATELDSPEEEEEEEESRGKRRR